MSLRINHNIASLGGQRNLQKNDAAVSKSLERLSSGLQINRASDNAAGLVISEQMRSQLAGLKQAVDNSETAVAMIQTSEGSLDEMSSLLSKMRELALHAANAATNDTSQVLADQRELDNAIDSITRIASTTQFGTKKLLDGTLAGANNYDSTKVYRFDVGSDLLSRADFRASMADLCVTTAGTKTSMSVAGGQITGTMFDAGGTQATTNLTSFLNGAVSAFGFTNTGSALSAASFFSAGTNYLAEGAALTITVKGIDFRFESGESVADILSKINNAQESYTLAVSSATSGVGPSMVRNVLGVGGDANDITYRFSNAVKASPTSAATAGSQSGSVALAAADVTRGTQTVAALKNVNIGGAATTISLVADTLDASILRANGYGILIDTSNAFSGAAGSLTVNLNKGALFQVGANASQQTAVDIKSMKAYDLGLGGDSRTSGRIENLASLKSRQSLVNSDFKGALQVIDKAIDDVTSLRGQLGAFQANTLETGLNSLRVTTENLTSAESTIRDVDFAKESAEFTKNNILVQASTSMLSQANQLPQGVLSLLGGR
jgi:flagellin